MSNQVTNGQIGDREEVIRLRDLAEKGQLTITNADYVAMANRALCYEKIATDFRTRMNTSWRTWSIAPMLLLTGDYISDLWDALTKWIIGIPRPH